MVIHISCCKHGIKHVGLCQRQLHQCWQQIEKPVWAKEMIFYSMSHSRLCTVCDTELIILYNTILYCPTTELPQLPSRRNYRAAETTEPPQLPSRRNYRAAATTELETKLKSCPLLYSNIWGGTTPVMWRIKWFRLYSMSAECVQLAPMTR